ncbi:acyl carrier protein [Streptomyces wuyuanensis]|uniref:Acyl carrier protein n=1 Tax=Streptomyces wuyuanensis TaxID=1196353 RepID=A0A1G9MLS1_9ACTN|nr:acyl carrier protein [Streptomyces wuyuanensis]SDL75236.1 acyl carrier protein [Streptomyces wuyuanensis]
MALDLNEILTGLSEIVNEVTGTPIEDVQPDKSFVDELDVDSLSMVEVIVSAEERFDIRIPEEEAKTFKTVRDAADFILLHAG